MSRFQHRLILLACLGLLLPTLAYAQESPAPGFDGAEDELRARIRAYQRQPDFERAITELDAMIEEPEMDQALRRAAYLLNIETHVLYGTSFYDEGKPNIAELNWSKAADLTRQMLGHATMRSTQPPEDAPTRMTQIFQTVRGEIFGMVQLESVEPEDAEVRLDGELLLPDPTSGIRTAVDVPVGQHTLLVRAEGYDDLITKVSVTPGGVISPLYELKKQRGWTWWAWRVGAGAAVGTGIYLLGGSDENPPAELDPLPGPPPPPSKR